MSCLVTLNGIAQDCLPNIGGVKRIWLGSFNQLNGAVEDTNDGGVNVVDVSPTEYKLPRGTASMTSTATIDETTGTRFFTNVVTAVFNRMARDKNEELRQIIGGELFLVAEDENNNKWLLSQSHPVKVTAVETTTGTAFSDANRYTLTFQVVTPEMPTFVNDIN